ncbi:hypothetical protein C8K44_10837 [Aminobacter sp. AP02]|nr:hypothetical protein C8K44_10837 [Aminobacter sp. AP02]
MAHCPGNIQAYKKNPGSPRVFSETLVSKDYAAAFFSKLVGTAEIVFRICEAIW